MLKRILLPTILLLLAYGFWVSPDVKVIAAGVAIFLFGMMSLEEGFRAFTGGALERLLQHTTSSTGRSLLFGVVSTTVMQSSSLVSVIAISFLSAGLITLGAGIGIIFGANLGTTTGAWLIAGFGLKVDIAAYAMPMLAFGVILIFQSSRSLKGIGHILAGLGFLFLGVHFMKEGFETFKETIDLADYAFGGYQGLFVFTAVGVLATVVMQSSHATLVLTITALGAGQITYENALALAIGANVGTTITAILGAMSSNEGGKRLAAAHFLFNVVTGTIAIAILHPLIDLVDRIAQVAGIAADDFTLKLAIFHSVFNLIGILAMLPLVKTMVTTLERLIPEKKPEVDQPIYLSSSSAEFPGTAAEAVRLETLRVYDAALRIIINGLGLRKEEVLSGADLRQGAAAQESIHGFDVDAMYERHIKGIYSAIVAFISDTAFSRREEASANLQWLREASTRLVEAVKDTHQLQENLIRYIGPRNATMREAYDRMRVEVALVIRDLEEMRQAGAGIMDALALDALKLLVDEHQNQLNEALTGLIGKRRITPAMGSSLINDSVYARDISMNLILAAQTLFSSDVQHQTQAAHDVALDRSDITEISRRTSAKDEGNR